MSRLIDADELIQHEFKNDISYKAFVNLVKRQPTIERKTGQWIKTDKYYEIGTIECSECHNKMTSLLDVELPNYCCYCGADMRGEQE